MKREIEYPGYKPSSTDGDYALLILDESVNSPSIIKPNSNSNYPPEDEDVTVMGWGDTNPSDWDSDLSDKLMKVTVKVITNEDCGQSSDGRDDYFGQITNNMLCARVNGGGKDACQVRTLLRGEEGWGSLFVCWNIHDMSWCSNIHLHSFLSTLSFEYSREIPVDHSSVPTMPVN